VSLSAPNQFLNNLSMYEYGGEITSIRRGSSLLKKLGVRFKTGRWFSCFW